jgi:hypothetical protein
MASPMKAAGEYLYLYTLLPYLSTYTQWPCHSYNLTTIYSSRYIIRAGVRYASSWLIPESSVYIHLLSITHHHILNSPHIYQKPYSTPSNFSTTNTDLTCI